MNNSSTKFSSFNACYPTKIKTVLIKNARNYINTSVSQYVGDIKNETSVIVKESRYVSGWKNDAKILSKDEFISKLKNKR